MHLLGVSDRGSHGEVGVIALYGRTVRAAGTDDNMADQYRQLALCRAIAAACDGQVIAKFFEDCRADTHWYRRLHGKSLLAALSRPGRVAGTAAVAVSWCLFQRPVPVAVSILARLACRRILLVLAGLAPVIRSAGKYAPLGRLLLGPASCAPLAGAITGPSACGHRPAGGTAVPALPGHRGQPR